MQFKIKKFISSFSVISVVLIISICFGQSSSAENLHQNLAPVAAKQEYTTYKNIPISGVVSAVDPEGDPISYAISKDPTKGSVEMNTDGSFVYTPKAGKTGRDTFNYVAVDSNGSISADTAVTIYIARLTTNVSYSDMENSDALYAAMLLAEEDIYIGAKLGDEYYFGPENHVTRGEFLIMCLHLCDIDKLDGTTKTAFSDDSEISMWMKPYAAAGLMNGIVTGSFDQNGEVVFAPSEYITVREAADILDSTIALSKMYGGPINKVSPVISYFPIEADPSGILPANIKSDDDLTRAGAAKMLAAAKRTLDK